MEPDEIIQSQQRSTAETMSVTSEGTSTSSISGASVFRGREELQELISKLGLTSIDELYQEKFRVDRQKLQSMLTGGDGDFAESATSFFRKVMNETNTFIVHPLILKVGVKAKKDPHIRVAGRPEDVQLAREKIMRILNARQNNRVTMKLDVSYVDHSHIIGKGGLTIKRVMEETGCHIHFPDSNRSNHQEKSNQVSIAGEMESVERARARIRNLTPLIFSFELPIMGSSQPRPDPTSAYVVKIQETYNVQVMFRTRSKLHATLVVVKGCEWEVTKVKDATLLLIHYMCEHLANQIQVQMFMEISPQHHSIVLGKQGSNLKMIMQRTATQIMFPDAGDPNIPSLKKSNVIITGAIRNVYLARQQLVGSLPLVLTFDLPENTRPSLDTDGVAQLMQTLEVFINVRNKPKQGTMSVIIKGIERNATNIYEARRRLLVLDEPAVHAEIPETYLMPNGGNFFHNNNNNSGEVNMMGLTENFAHALKINTLNSSPVCMPGGNPGCLSHSPSPMDLYSPWGLPGSVFSPLAIPPGYPAYQHSSNILMNASQLMQLSSSAHRPQGIEALGQLQQHHPGICSGYATSDNSLMHSDSKETSGYSSLNSLSSAFSSPAITPRNISPVNPSENSLNFGIDRSNMLSDLGDRRAPGCEKKTLSFALYDYEKKRAIALKAMQNKVKPFEQRVPNSVWSGYGLSYTMPAISETTESYEKLASTSSIWDNSPTPMEYTLFDFDTTSGIETPGMTSNYLEHTPSKQVEMLISKNYTDLATMLVDFNLEKYLRLFNDHEIDMTTFSSLTDNDLCEIGISAWGARRKMLLIISELKKRSRPFRLTPGAERKRSRESDASLGSSIEPTSNVSNRDW